MICKSITSAWATMGVRWSAFQTGIRLYEFMNAMHYSRLVL